MDIRIELPDAEIDCAAVLLDMDGVLVDSLETIERHLREWSLKHGLDPQYVIDRSPGRTNGDLVAEVAPFLDAGIEAQRLLQQEIVDTAGITACPGAADLLAALPSDAWAVVTSGNRPVALNRLDAAGLPVPETLVTADDVQAGKPAPDGYLLAARTLGVAPARCVVIEDAPAGLAAARAAAMTTIAISDGQGTPPAPCDHLLRSLTMLEIKISTE